MLAAIAEGRPGGVLRRGLGFAFLWFAALACGRSEAPKPAPSSPSASTPSARAGSRLASSTAFELVVGPRGATLVLAPSGGGRGALARVELDVDGTRRGSAALVLAARGGDVTDISAAFVDERLAVAWLERSGAGARVRATWAAPRAPVFELGAAWRGPPAAHGNVMVAAWRGAALVFARGEEAPCVEPGKTACYAFSFHELGAEGAKRGPVSLSVPVPCTDHATSLVVMPGRYHYGVCTETGSGPVTTVFTITPEPAYARADPVLEGCEPVGTFTWRSSAWLVAQCQGNRRAARIGAADEDVEYLDLRSLRLECRAGAATLRAAGFELELDSPRGRLEALLPNAMAPRGSRAVWTGQALLVASAAATSLRLARYTCRGDAWLETNVDID
ncbi:MAG TPA: hypothetical protein VFZ53_07720 [Polyangiaceae bacterium]